MCCIIKVLVTTRRFENGNSHRFIDNDSESSHNHLSSKQLSPLLFCMYSSLVIPTVLGNSTEWIFDIRRLDRAQKGGFHFPYWILGRRKVNKCTEMDENKVECGKIP